MNFKHVALFASSVLFLLSCEPESSFEDRRLAAKALLSNKCEFVVNASTEFIKEKRPVLGALVGVVVSSKCDCITDSLAVEFANEYDLQTIQDMEQQPIESFGVILDKFFDKNDKMVVNCVKQL